MVLVLVLLIAVYLIGSCRILKQYDRGVIFFLGRFEGVRGPGLTLVFFPIQQMTRVSFHRRRSSPATTSRSISPPSPTTTSPIPSGR